MSFVRESMEEHAHGGGVRVSEAGGAQVKWYRVPSGAFPGVTAPDELVELRGAGLRALNALLLPDSKDEEWKYTSLASLERRPFRAAGQARPDSTLTEQARELLLDDLGNMSAVFVNGSFVRELSHLDGVPPGLEFLSLAEVAQGRDLLRTPRKWNVDVGLVPPDGSNFIAAFNSAHCRDLLSIRVEAGLVLQEPIQLIYLVTDEGEPTFSCPRVRFMLGEGSAVSVVERYASFGGVESLVVPVVEAKVGARAALRMAKLVLESERTTHLSLLSVNQERESQLVVHTLSFGGALVRNELRPVLNGEGCETLLNGLTVIRDEQHVDNHLVVEHAAPSSFSRELFKGIYSGRATGVFSGTIVVRKDAQKTNAVQSNQSLLLSREATIETRPQLKIFADDVKCTHGATVGQLDESALFYLRTRGIPEPEARNILIHAFAEDVLESMGNEPLQKMAREQLEASLNSSLKSE